MKISIGKLIEGIPAKVFVKHITSLMSKLRAENPKMGYSTLYDILSRDYETRLKTTHEILHETRSKIYNASELVKVRNQKLQMQALQMSKFRQVMELLKFLESVSIPVCLSKPIVQTSSATDKRRLQR